jgi:hypothetical protein
VTAARGLGPSPPAELLLTASAAGAAVVTRAASCDAILVALDPDGRERGRRPVAAGGCGGRDVSVHGIEAYAGGVALGGALRGEADLGGGVERPSATDGFAMGVAP